MKPSSLLKFQIGPVQEFIAQARSTRDLWSGSYLLSWLVASGLNCLMQKGAEAGLTPPQLADCVIFPSLQSQPIMQHRQPSLFPPPASAGGGTDRNDELLTPNLTNLFLAELPLVSGKASEIAKEIEAAIRSAWKEIAMKCWAFGQNLLAPSDRDRFELQVSSLLQISWQVTDLVSPNEASAALLALPLSAALRAKVAAANAADRALAATLARNAWQLDAVRQVRGFDGWRDVAKKPGRHNEKDSLSGREERIAGGHGWWKASVKGRSMEIRLKNGASRSVDLPLLFRERQAGEYFGAITFIKRVWHLAYLEPEHGLRAGHRKDGHGKQFPFPSTLHIASHDPAKNEDDPREVSPDEASEQSRYFAVLTMDGDEMGKWMSGEKFAGPATGEALRDVSHRLSTFGLKCARPIVEACDGRLIYAGGDDVVALLPADTALACAGFLRQAFKGQTELITGLKDFAVKLLSEHTKKKRKDSSYSISPHLTAAAEGSLFAAFAGRLILKGASPDTFSLPGEICGGVADVSTGIAIAHFKSPLQDVIREAQRAEKRAKNQLGRSAVAVTLFKRSGETIEWGCKWDTGGLNAFSSMLDALQTRVVSSKFPHRIVELVDGYQTGEPGRLGGTESAPGFDVVVREVLGREIGTAAERQKGRNYRVDKVAEIQQAIGAYLDSLPESRRKVDALIGLCQTVAFIERNLSGGERETSSLKPETPTNAERQPVTP